MTVLNGGTVQAMRPEEFQTRVAKWRDSASHTMLYWETVESAVARPLAAIQNTVGSSGDQQLRHRHVMEQVRYYVAGKVNYGRKGAEGELSAGDLLYVPESVFYGPMRYEPHTRLITFQFTGASELSEYVQRDDAERAATELAQHHGEFDGKAGTFRWNDGRVTEGVEALLEHLRGRPVEYAEARYDAPIVVHGKHVDWVDARGLEGAKVKHLGYFNEFGPNVKLVSLEAEAVVPAGVSASQQIRVVLTGRIRFSGRSYAAGSALYYTHGAAYDQIEAEEPSEMVIVQLAPRNAAPVPFCEI